MSGIVIKEVDSRWLSIGAGWGQLQIESLQTLAGLEVTALCDVDAARAKDIARKHNLYRI